MPRKRPRWQWLRRIRDTFPITITGLLVGAASALAILYYGRVRLDRLLFAVGGVGLALVALGLVLVTVATLIAWRSAKRALRGQAEALRIECGAAIPTGFSIRRPWWLPLVNVRWSWIEPVAEVTQRREAGRDHEAITASRRDQFAEIVRRFEVSDVFGLIRIAFPVREKRGGRFAPSVGALSTMHVAHGLSGGDAMSHHEGSPTGDYYDARRYAAGDPIKFILWKVFARTRNLLVRAPEPAASPDRRTIAYLVTGTGDEAAAGAARVAVDSGALGVQWLLGVDGSTETATSRDKALDLLARSARADTAGGNLDSFLRGSSAGAMSRALVFVPARPGPWLDQVARTASAPVAGQPRVEFVVCTDGVTSRVKRSAISRAMVSAPSPGELATHDDLLAVVEALGKTGANILVADRPGGRVIAARSLRGAL
jgi:uncharacterized protein (DUF58 family)